MRRRFFLLAAPAIVAAPTLMKVSTLVMPPPAPYADMNGLVTATLRARMPYLIENINQTNALLQRMSGIPSFLYGRYDGYILPKPETNRLTS